jgi:hypothetical protein
MPVTSVCKSRETNSVPTESMRLGRVKKFTPGNLESVISVNADFIYWISQL